MHIRAVGIVTVLASVSLGLPILNAQELPDRDVDNLIARMGEISAEANIKNEEVKQLAEDLKAAEAGLPDFEHRATEATALADDALRKQRDYQRSVNSIAQAKYRGAVKDRVTQVIGSNNPQNAIDRSAYFATLTHTTEKVVESLQQATREANEARNEARQALEEAKFKRNNIIARQKDLEREKEELKTRITEVINQVDALSPAERARWVEKNGPVDYTLAGIEGDNPSGMQALEVGLTKLGSPYGWGSAGPDAFDCSGLVVWSYAQQGKVLPRTSQAQMSGGKPISRAELQPGDVVGFYPGATHVGIYAGNNKVLHASDYGIPVQVVSMDSMPFYGARRY
ncbi:MULTISPECIES: C40 family peptidase [unclassified Corynebacterium]|uniref:C40 family peptidase n=1 Tax=unclassified Corynebacterium TaxID=2624378 RepID=UPI002167E6CE|nr:MULTISPECIES: C40 family peptidase [unclassified Corynebacterium]MCS4490804.1 NlpC/P60 family protein [Corynebacterium sp. ES2715-CONJ3]MCS4531313.1 NlpC/P60 family protein [Corynebacterium sp. ES2730-CONJ]